MYLLTDSIKIKSQPQVCGDFEIDYSLAKAYDDHIAVLNVPDFSVLKNLASNPASCDYKAVQTFFTNAKEQLVVPLFQFTTTKAWQEWEENCDIDNINYEKIDGEWVAIKPDPIINEQRKQIARNIFTLISGISKEDLNDFELNHCSEESGNKILNRVKYSQPTTTQDIHCDVAFTFAISVFSNGATTEIFPPHQLNQLTRFGGRDQFSLAALGNFQYKRSLPRKTLALMPPALLHRSPDQPYDDEVRGPTRRDIYKMKYIDYKNRARNTLGELLHPDSRKALAAYSK